jgi:phosphatidylglycerophosphatase C
VVVVDALAIFDVDGTLVARGSAPRFALVLGGPPAAVGAIASGARSAVRHLDPARFKTGALRRLLAGRDAADVERVGAAFADRLLRSSLRAKEAGWLRWHLDQGHEVVLVTSALDVYARPLGAALGASDVIASEVVVERSRCTGDIRDAELSGDRKVEAVEGWLAARRADPVVVYAYGDSRGDRELLAWARSTRVA